MRLIDADLIMSFVGGYLLLMDDSPAAHIILDTVKIVVDKTPTVDAIPVEQVARMLCEYAEDRRPCDRNDGYSSSMRDEFCHECEARTNYPKNAYDCWLHAIKEGWLDDAE